MDASAMALQNRVKLTWREVRDLEREAAAREKQAVRGAQPAQESAAPDAPFEEVRTPHAALIQEASAELRAAAAAKLAPKIEASVRAALRETLDAALANALARAKSDVERSLSTVIAQAVAKELESLPLAELTKRRS